MHDAGTKDYIDAVRPTLIETSGWIDYGTKGYHI